MVGQIRDIRSAACAVAIHRICHRRLLALFIQHGIGKGAGIAVGIGKQAHPIGFIQCQGALFGAASRRHLVGRGNNDKRIRRFSGVFIRFKHRHGFLAIFD